jgi:hypothetical protein
VENNWGRWGLKTHILSYIHPKPTHMVFSVSSTNKTDRHNIAQILLNVALNTIDLSYVMEKLSFCIYLFIDIMDKDKIYIDKMFCFTNMHSTHKHIYKSAITFWKEVWNEGKCYNIKRTTSACFLPWVAIYAFCAV